MAEITHTQNVFIGKCYIYAKINRDPCTAV